MKLLTDEKINILLVEDLPENLLVTEAIIDKEEFNLVKVTSGEEAIKQLLKNDFALILLDVQMPDMDGFTTAKIIKAREKTKNIPILFITANNMETEHIFMGYSVGAIDYILKPVDPLILKAKVDRFVDIHKMKRRLVMKKNKLAIINQELKDTSSRLQISEALANVISETSKDAMLVFDETGNILKANPTSTSQLQYKQAELLGTNIRCIFTETKSKQFIENIFIKISTHGQLAGQESKREVAITRSDGTTFLSDVYVGIQTINDTMIIAVTIRDITQEIKNQALIKHMAYHDFLTDLPNRRSLTAKLLKLIKKAQSENQTIGLLYLDIDRFKYINDSLGRSIGDRVLQEIASRLTNDLRKDDFLAHLGGDEFSIILPNTSRDTVLEIAETIIESFQQPLMVNNYELYITTSIGLSIFPYDGDDFEELIRNSFIALHKAKELGKNNYHIYQTGMNMQTYRSFMMQNDFRKAIERHEFMLHYQPRVDTLTGKIRSAEALLRWNHPNWGIVSPSEFILLAEDTGQISEIGNWVFRNVCEQIKEWDKKELPVTRISINFSASQFLQKNLFENIEKVLKETGVAADRLEIEITESMLIENEALTINTLQKLRELGIVISLDDFGTGYSSLHNLSKLPIDILKIDKEFIKGVESISSTNHLITKMIIALGKSLNLSIIAEGVTTEKQSEFLNEEGCEEYQGYLFSPPVTNEELEKMIIDASYKTVQQRTKIVEEDQEQASTNEIPIPFTLVKLKKKHDLSQRESEVFEQMITGLTNKEISEKLFISEHTVKNHITHIFRKLNVSDRSQAMAMVYRYVVEN